MASDPYSRLITVLKVALPLVALGILSTVFLVSSRIEPGDSIPFAEGEVAERIRSQQVTGPLFSGVTRGGDRITFSADDIVTADNANAAQNPVAQIDFSGGARLWLEADRGNVDLTGDLATMTDNVVIRDTLGFVMQSDLITSRLSSVEVVSPGNVTADGPLGHLEAGSMRVEEKDENGNVQLLFMRGVKLIYEPEETD
jgi:lipopolysaccharide export system protein LptC